jgi:hypothetical protein
MSKSMWGDIGVRVPTVPNPTQLLREQAAALELETGGMLIGDVSDRTLSFLGLEESLDPDPLRRPIRADVLSIRAPALNGYELEVIRITYPIGFYPADLYSYLQRTKFVANDETEFGTILQSILQSAEVKDAIKKILQHVASDK